MVGPPTAREFAIRTATAKEQGPFANPARAAEIALMDKLGLAEFTELTGVGVGDYGIYRVGQNGVSLRATEHLADVTAVEQNTIHQAARLLTLTFPCAPDVFLKWYDATRGAKPHPKASPSEPPASDFPLAEGFLDTLGAGGGPARATLKNSAPAPSIIAAFRVKLDETENWQWWDNRMRSAIKYKLTDARVSLGKGPNPSRWDPLQIAAWLIDKGHLSKERVRRAVEANFPKIDSSLL